MENKSSLPNYRVMATRALSLREMPRLNEFAAVVMRENDHEVVAVAQTELFASNIRACLSMRGQLGEYLECANCDKLVHSSYFALRPTVCDCTCHGLNPGSGWCNICLPNHTENAHQNPSVCPYCQLDFFHLSARSIAEPKLKSSLKKGNEAEQESTHKTVPEKPRQYLHRSRITIHVKRMAGHILTTLDAAYINEQHNKAVKQLVKRDIRQGLSDMHQESFETGFTDEDCTSGPDVLE